MGERIITYIHFFLIFSSKEIEKNKVCGKYKWRYFKVYRKKFNGKYMICDWPFGYFRQNKLLFSFENSRRMHRVWIHECPKQYR